MGASIGMSDRQCGPRGHDENDLLTFMLRTPEWARQMGYTSVQTQQTVSLNLAHLGFEATTAGRGTVIVGLALANSEEA